MGKLNTIVMVTLFNMENLFEMMIQAFANEGAYAFSIQAPRVQKLKKKAALEK